MCLLTYFPPKQQPDVIALTTGAINNPHGSGWAIVNGDRIIRGRSMDDEKAIRNFIAARAVHSDGPALFHSRIATAGLHTKENCHPFIVGGDPRTYVAHNGILPSKAQPSNSDPRSDTRLFAEKYLPSGRFGYLYSRRGRKHLERWLGSGNKLVILSVDPRLPRSIILNEKQGTWDKGIWYSNTSYFEDPYERWYSRNWSTDNYGRVYRYVDGRWESTREHGGLQSDGTWKDYVSGNGTVVSRWHEQESTWTCEYCPEPKQRGSAVHINGKTICIDCRSCDRCGQYVAVGKSGDHHCPPVLENSVLGYEPDRICVVCGEVDCINAAMFCSRCRCCQDCGTHESECSCWVPRQVTQSGD